MMCCRPRLVRAKDGPARLDALDDPVAGPIGAEIDPVAGGDDVPLIGAERAQQPPGDALMQRAVVGLDDARQAMHLEHAAAAARFADVRQNGESPSHRCRSRCADHRALASQFAFAADPLVARGVDRSIFVGGEGSGEIAGRAAGHRGSCEIRPESFCVFCLRLIPGCKLSQLSLGSTLNVNSTIGALGAG